MRGGIRGFSLGCRELDGCISQIIAMEVGEDRRSVHGSEGQLSEGIQDIRYTPTA